MKHILIILGIITLIVLIMDASYKGKDKKK